MHRHIGNPNQDHRTIAISVASALVSSLFDYANSAVFGCPMAYFSV